MVGEPLPRAFYERPTLEVARGLIGKTLARRTDAGVMAGVIVETEAYIAAVDPAAHGYRGMTRRTQVMFGAPGYAYVYVSYGMHVCLNVVTEPVGEAAAVLIRALEPVRGIALMRARRGERIADRNLCRGPGRLCQALGITLAEGGADLRGPSLWIAEAASDFGEPPVATSPRIGITRAVELPWRFYMPENRYVSGTKSRILTVEDSLP